MVNLVRKPPPQDLEGTTVSLAEDTGNLELLNASYRDHHIPDHFHEEFSISVSTRGGLAFDHRGTKHVAPTGVISAINPAEVHNAYPATAGGWAFRCFLIPVHALATVSADTFRSHGVPAFPRRVILDDALARQLVHLHRTLETSRELLERQSLCVSTLAALLQRHSTDRLEVSAVKLQREPVRRVREYLNDCYGQRISLNQLALISGLSRFHFLRVFRAEVGLTPHAYLRQVRVLNAKRLLAAGSAPAQIALQCGFADQSHMARQFKELLGFTPGQFQAAHTIHK